MDSNINWTHLQLSEGLGTKIPFRFFHFRLIRRTDCFGHWWLLCPTYPRWQISSSLSFRILFLHYVTIILIEKWLLCPFIFLAFYYQALPRNLAKVWLHESHVEVVDNFFFSGTLKCRGGMCSFFFYLAQICSMEYILMYIFLCRRAYLCIFFGSFNALAREYRIAWEIKISLNVTHTHIWEC